MKTKEQIIVFIKNPEVGKVKTRLAKTIGNEKALGIYLKLVDHTIKEIEKSGLQSHLFFSEKIDHSYVGQNFSVQFGDDLGERMNAAFQECFANEKNKVIIIGTDCPGISSEILQKAFKSLDTNEVVIGPALDGGYYLLGMKKMHRELFANMKWSTDYVYNETIKRLNKLQLTYQELEILRDLDNEEDLRALSKDFGYLHID